MKKRKTINEASFIPAVEWLRRLSEETSSFEIVKVVESQPAMGVGRRMEWDYVVTVAPRPDNRRIDLFVETRSQLTPQTALATFQRLKWVPPDGLILVCAPYISPRVAEMCREQNVNYLDGVGNCRIAAPGLFIQISGHPNRRATTKPILDPFSKKSSRIVRTLLTHPEKAWQVQQLAKAADVSLGLVSKVKKALIEEAFLEERGRLLHLRDPVGLLQAWAVQYRPHVNRLQLFAMTRPAETESRLGDWCRENEILYALTQLAAAWRYSPMVRYEKSVIFVDRKVITNSLLMSLLNHIDAKEVDTGANCILWLTDDPAVFTGAKEINGLKVVSPIQLYLDLKLLAGRGEEAAQEILEKALQPFLMASRKIGGTSPGENHE